VRRSLTSRSKARDGFRGGGFVVGDGVSVADFVLAYTLDWANEVHLLTGSPNLLDYVERMYHRSHAPPRIAAALATVTA
jgi:glutathione S-transferase